MNCTVDGCPHTAKRRGLCWGHYRRDRRKQPLLPLRAWGRSGWELLRDAALRYADTPAEADQRDWENAKKLLRMARTRSARKAAHKVHT